MSKKVSIDVDEDQQEQVLHFLEMLNIGDKGKKKGKNFRRGVYCSIYTTHINNMVVGLERCGFKESSLD